MRFLTVGLILVAILCGSAAAQLQVPDAEQGRLQADRIRYDARTGVLHAEGRVRFTLGDTTVQAARLTVDRKGQTVKASGDVVVRQPGGLLRAAELTYAIRTRMIEATGTVALDQDDMAITASEMKIDLSARIVRARGGVRLEHPDGTLTGETLVARMKTKEAEVSGQASLLRRTPRPSDVAQAGKALIEETRITADRMRLRWETDEAEAEGGVSVTQPGRTARAERLVYSDSRDLLELTGQVVVHQRDAERLTGGERAAGDTAAPTTIACDRLVVHLRTQDLTAEGAIQVEQEGRLATGDRAVYTARDRVLVVTGHVRIRETDGSWLRADKVIISLAEETFEAEGSVETEFSVKRGK